MNISNIQLFVLMQDTVCHLRTGKHLTSNYKHCKNEVVKAFGKKKASSITLLVYIGHIYMTCLEDTKTFSDYLKKYPNLTDQYNIELDRIAED